MEIKRECPDCNCRIALVDGTIGMEPIDDTEPMAEEACQACTRCVHTVILTGEATVEAIHEKEQYDG